MAQPQLNTKLYWFIILTGLAAGTFLLYLRLIKEYAPKSISYPMASWEIYFYSILLGINIFLLVFMVIAWKKPSKGFFQAQWLKVYTIIGEAFYILYTKIFTKYITKILKSGLRIKRKYSYTNLVLFLKVFLILPRVFLLLVFLVDIFYFQELFIFYKFLWILLLPFLVKFVLFIYQDTCERGMEDLLQYFELIPESPDDYPSHFPYKFIPLGHIIPKHRLKREVVAKSGYDLVVGYYWCYFTVLEILPVIIVLRNTEQSIQLFLGIITRVSYIIGWSYILFIGTNAFTSFPFSFFPPTSLTLNYFSLPSLPFTSFLFTSLPLNLFSF